MSRELLLTSATLAGRPFMSTDMGGINRGFGLPRVNYAPDGTGAGQIDSTANDILSKLEDGAGQGDGGEESEEQTAERIAAEPDKDSEESESDDTADQGEQDQDSEEDQPESAIEPPVSWKADAKELFGKLPRELQERVAKRESEREAVISKTHQEAADQRKAHDADRNAMQQDRLHFSETVKANYLFARSQNEYIAEGDKLEAELRKGNTGPWQEILQKNPTARDQYKMMVEALDQSFSEPFRKAEDARKSHAAEITKQNEAMVASAKTALEGDPILGPMLKDDGKRKEVGEAIRTYMAASDYKPDEMDRLVDPRAVRDIWKASQYDKLMAQQRAIPAAKKKPVPGKTVRANASQDADDGDDKGKRSAMNRAKAVRGDSEKADAIARLLD